MNDEHMYVYEEAEDLSIGETSRKIQCPRCGRDKSFSVTRLEDEIKYNCFRAICSCSGGISLNSLDKSELSKKTKSKTFVPKYYHKPLYRLTEPLRNLITSTWGISRLDQIQNGFKWAKDDNRLYMPIYNHLGEQVGANTKILDKCDLQKWEPKSIAYWREECLRLDFPSDTIWKANYEDKDTIVVVEDKLSAIRVARRMPCVSLCGVGLSEESATFLASQYKNLIIALDSDTWHTDHPIGKRLKDMYSLYFDKVRMLYIKQDFKDMKEEELKCALK